MNSHMILPFLTLTPFAFLLSLSYCEYFIESFANKVRTSWLFTSDDSSVHLLGARIFLAHDHKTMTKFRTINLGSGLLSNIQSIIQLSRRTPHGPSPSSIHFMIT